LALVQIYIGPPPNYINLRLGPEHKSRPNERKITIILGHNYIEKLKPATHCNIFYDNVELQNLVIVPSDNGTHMLRQPSNKSVRRRMVTFTAPQVLIKYYSKRKGDSFDGTATKLEPDRIELSF